MSEFGHHYGRLSGDFPGCWDSWGSGPFVIVLEGADFRFEDSDRFGPLLLNKDGRPSERQPGERSPFWKAYNAWRRQGRRTADDGKTCVWDKPRPTKVRRIRGRHVEIIEDGDEDGDVEIIEGPS